MQTDFAKPHLLARLIAGIFPTLLCAGACTDPKTPTGNLVTDSGTPGADGGTFEETGTDTIPCDAPAAEPGLDREGNPADGWNWQRLGPLWSDTEAFAYNQGHLAPSIVQFEGEMLLLFTRQVGPEQTLWSARSTDGRVWSTPELVTGLEESGGSYPSLLVYQGELRLYYGSGSIAWATSTDGRDFSPQGSILRPGPSGRFDAVSPLYPHAVEEVGEDGDVLALYYTGFDGARFAIGRAESVDGGETWSSGELHLERRADAWDNAAVGMPRAHTVGEERLLWYGGYDTIIANPGPWRIGLKTGDTRSVSLPLTAEGTEAYSTRDPALLPYQGGWLMIYAGMGDDGIYRLHAATSSVCSG
jgi:hypothetical protein